MRKTKQEEAVVEKKTTTRRTRKTAATKTQAAKTAPATKTVASSEKKPLALIIMDGFGHRDSDKGNAIHAAKTPNMDKYMKECPHVLIGA